MLMKRSVLALLTTFALAIGLIAHSMAAPPEGKGGGKNGGGEDPPTVAVVYDLQMFDLPADYYGNHFPQQMNLYGELVGWYSTNDGEQPYYLNINADAPSVVNLNEIAVDPQFEVPEGWYIYAATGINSWGDISLALARLDIGSELLRGAVLELRPAPFDSTVLPRIHVLPDEAWDRTYPRRINDAGIVLGRGDAVTSYTYQVGLHGGIPGTVTLVPAEFDAFDAWMNNETESHLTQIVWNAGGDVQRYTVGDLNVEVFLAEHSTLGISDAGEICGEQQIEVKRNRTDSIGFRFDGASIYGLPEIDHARAINSAGDVLGPSDFSRLTIVHAELGNLNLDDYVVGRTPAEQLVWESYKAYFSLMSERNVLGTHPSVANFPAVFGRKSNQLFVLMPVPAN